MNNKPNPYPQGDISSRLQRKSIKKFEALLPEHLFIFRDERIDDYGVDGSLEILIDGNPINMRAQVQLKSKQKKQARKDGIVTLQIETSNLNYLLNGPLGLYILYIEETDELFYTWASDENRRHISMDSDWKDQGTISIPFEQQLNESTLNYIYDRIYQEVGLHRKILETLAYAPSNDKVSIVINTNTLNTENSIEIENIIESTGITLVAAGYAHVVLEKLSLITYKASISSRFKLISSYANFTIGKYQTALGEAADAAISEDLQDEDRKFAERLHLASKLNLGVITNDEYYKNLEKQALCDEGLLEEIKLQKLIDEFRSLSVYDKKILDEIKNIRDKVVNSEIFPDNLKFSVRVKYIEIAGLDSIHNILNETITIVLSNNNPFVVDKSSNSKYAFQYLENWLVEANDLVQYAIRIGNPIFVADALTSKVFIKVLLLTYNIALITFQGESISKDLINQEVSELINFCNQSLEIYKISKMIEGEVRLQLIMAQIFEINGQEEEAKKIAQAVSNQSKFLGYKRHFETAKEIIDGNSLFSQIMKSIDEIVQQKKIGVFDVSPLSTNEGLEFYADQTLQMYGLPRERRENIIIDFQCLRDIMIEKNEFCRHIQVLQDQQHIYSHHTMYTINPNRCIECSKLGYLVNQLTPEWTEQIKIFKNIYCTLCPSRETSRNS